MSAPLANAQPQEVTMCRTWVQVGDGRALSVRVDRPAREQVKGVVVLLPPFGREEVSFHRTMVAAAVTFARAGHLVYTPSLSGEGDSAALPAGRDLGEVWREDVDAVVDAAAAHASGASVTLVGVRLGGALASASTHPNVGRVIRWDAISGRRFARAQVMLSKVFLSAEDVTRLQPNEFLGMSLDDRQLASLQAIGLPKSTNDEHVCVDAQPDQATTTDIAPEVSRVAREGIAEVGDQLLNHSSVQVDPNWKPDTSVEVETPDGPVEEQFVRVGRRALLGIATRRTGSDRGAFAVVYTAAGSDAREGPGRGWVTSAHEVARRGGLALRVDRRHIGDDVDPDLDAPVNPYEDGAADDVSDALAWARSRSDGPVIGIGVCSGAWLMLRAATRTRVDAIVVVNSLYWTTSARGATSSYDAYLTRPWSSNSVVQQSPSAGASVLRAVIGQIRAFMRGRARLRNLAFSVASGSLGVPALVAVALRTRTLVYVLNGDDEAHLFRSLGGQLVTAVLASVGRGPRVRQEAVLEHGLLTEASRRFVLDLLPAEVLSQVPARADRS